jgi:hypothetical protein
MGAMMYFALQQVLGAAANVRCASLSLAASQYLVLTAFSVERDTQSGK